MCDFVSSSGPLSEEPTLFEVFDDGSQLLYYDGERISDASLAEGIVRFVSPDGSADFTCPKRYIDVLMKRIESRHG